jgi:putative sterol carrier protein
VTPLSFASAEWAGALRAAIDDSSEYRNSGSKWGVGFNGNILFAFERDSLLPESVCLLLRLEAGRCGGAEIVPGPTHPDAGFTLRGPYTLWRDILTGRTLAATAILTGKMHVEGDPVTLLKHAGAHRALIHCVASVETRYPDA